MNVPGMIMHASSFETNFDGWTTGGMDRPFFRWTGSTATPATGPSAAAIGSFYLVALTSDGDTVFSFMNFDLEKTFPVGQTLYGVSFQYHMHGSSIGSVVLESSVDASSWASLWSKSSDQGDQWLQATVYAGSGQTLVWHVNQRPGPDL